MKCRYYHFGNDTTHRVCDPYDSVMLRGCLALADFIVAIGWYLKPILGLPNTL